VRRACQLGRVGVPGDGEWQGFAAGRPRRRRWAFRYCATRRVSSQKCGQRRHIHRGQLQQPGCADRDQQKWICPGSGRPRRASATLSYIVPNARKAMVCHSRQS
jgi:hypothetical protein